MADDFMDPLEPFDLKDAISFDEAVLSGFLADKFDVSSEKSLPRANSRSKGIPFETVMGMF